MNKKIITLLLACLSCSLTACNFINLIDPTGGQGGDGGDVVPHQDDSQDEVEIEGLTSEYTNPNANPISKPSSGTTNVNIVAINDFHGAVEATSGRVGLLKLGSYLVEKGNTENTLILDQGDTWQGSIYSNYNHGKLISDVYNYAHVHAHTVGNHDFDWGVEKLKENTAKELLGYKTPSLAANVYDYNFSSKTIGSVQQSDIGAKSVTYTLKNGLKVGIVGVIGQDQITSITSKYVEDICFINHVNVIKDTATELRNDGCDIVIASIHADQDDVLNNDLSSYVDLVLCAHSHQYEYTVENGTYFCQFAANGERVGEINLTYNYGTNKVTNTSFVARAGSDFSNVTTNANISKIVNAYNTVSSEAANTVVASNAMYFAKSEQAVNLMCKAIFDETKREKHNVILAMCNTSRAYLPQGVWHYSDLYQSFPFDNRIEIIDVLGSDIYNEMRYNNVCFNPDFDLTIHANQRYKVAVLDYLAYHTNSSRRYDYFPSITGSTIKHLTNNYRIILRDWLIRCGYNQSGQTLSNSAYSNDNASFDVSLVSYIH